MQERLRLTRIKNRYVDGAIFNLKGFKTHAGDQGVADLNKICSAHVLTMDLDEDNKTKYNGCVVKDGKLVMLFNEKQLGMAVRDALAPLQQALNDASREGGDAQVSFAATAGIRKNYDEKIEPRRAALGKILGKPDIKFTPNFEDTFAKLAEEIKKPKTGLVKNWEAQLGRFTWGYFDTLVTHMDRSKFGTDEMLQEGFNDSVDKGEIAFRIVDTLKYQKYCECVIEGGVLYLQVCISSNRHYWKSEL